MRHLLDNRKGQMTVEMAIAFPVLIVVAMIAFNALQFFSACASFDRLSRNWVRVEVVSPSYGKELDLCCEVMEEGLRNNFDEWENIDVGVSCKPTGFDFTEFSATLEFYPTLFGLELRSQAFGVSLPSLSHTVRYVVDCYRPGVIL